MEDKFLTEGILNQFVKTISEDIPILLASLCKDYFCVDDEVTKIVEDHLLERIYLTDSTYYEKIKTPEQNVMKALERKRRYQLKRLFEETGGSGPRPREGVKWKSDYEPWISVQSVYPDDHVRCDWHDHRRKC